MIGSKPTDSGRAPQAVEQSALMEALIKATEQLLTEMRPESISTIRIASRAGVSIGTLMQLFRNKDAIVAEAMARRRRAERAAAAPPISPAARPPAPAPSRPPGVPPAPPVTSRNPTPPPVPPPRPAPPPAAMLFRKPAPAPPREEPEPRPAISRLPEPPAPPAAPAPRVPAPPAAPRETLEEAMASVVRPLVAAFAALLPSLAGMPQAERDAKTRAELKRMAATSQTMLARQNVPDPSHVAYVMTLTCDRVIKDAMRSAPESFSDGRLEQALCRLCIDFVRSG